MTQDHIITCQWHNNNYDLCSSYTCPNDTEQNFPLSKVYPNFRPSPSIEAATSKPGDRKKNIGVLELASYNRYQSRKLCKFCTPSCYALCSYTMSSSTSSFDNGAMCMMKL